MATAIFRFSIFVPLLLILLATFYRASCGMVGENLETISASGGSIRSPLGVRRNNQISNCSEMVSKPQCSLNSKCRWCRSDALDDMCFSKSEARRLPFQVFSCD